jgi:lysyl endopeptidase
MKLLISICLLFATSVVFSQIQGNGGIPKGLKQKNFTQHIDHRSFSQPNIEQLRAEDKLVDNTGTAPWRFGFNNYTSLRLNNSGTWINLPNGDKIWMLKLTCVKALTVNLTFSNTTIPQGNELYVYNVSKDFILGKFTANHLYNGELGTELIPGNTAVVEYYVKKGTDIGNIEISIVTHGYRTSSEFQEKAFGSSGSCNRNVNCPEGAAWTNERNSVVMLVSGSNGFCTGALVNNVLNDGKPYVLTADHCYSNPANWIFRFKWQSADCNNPSSSPTFESLSGAVLRARGTASDFCLVEITGGLVGGTVPSSHTPYFCGWDNSGATPQSGVGIHHPAGDIKKISFENQPLISTSFGSSPANSHWGVTNWDSGVTEGGSSGSPLFDQNHRIIGQLHGGASACGAPNLSDEYGKFSVSWNPSGSNNSGQLKFWLDPNNSGAQFIDGYDPSGATPVQVDAGITNPQGVNGRLCYQDVSPSVTITNSGAQTLTSATILYSFDSGAVQTFNWTGSLPQWQSTSVNLPTFTLNGGDHTFSATINNPNVSVDENNNNNNSISSFSVVVDGEDVNLDLILDCYGSEVTWELQDNSNTAIYYSSGYSDNSPGLVQEQWCLNEGCYTFLIMDSYGDGLTGDPSCSPDGSLQITVGGDSLTGIAQVDANFGSQAELQFCIEQSSMDDKQFGSFNLFPNPAKDYFIITWTQMQFVEIEVISLFGQTLLKESANTNEIKIKTDKLAAGAYLIRLNCNGKSLVKRLVIN